MTSRCWRTNAMEFFSLRISISRWLLPPVRLGDGQRFFSLRNGGERGIRTPDTLSGMPVFKTGAINHSAISPITTFLLQFRRNPFISYGVHVVFKFTSVF